MPHVYTETSAVMSLDGLHRELLFRRWTVGRTMGIIALNPSTADHREDDPTIHREVSLAMREGYGALLKANLFTFRATDRAAMKRCPAPVSSQADEALRALCRRADGPIVVAWGADGGHRGRDREVLRLLRAEGAELVCLGLTKDGHPKHPLYLKGDTPLEPYLWGGI